MKSFVKLPRLQGFGELRTFSENGPLIQHRALHSNGNVVPTQKFSILNGNDPKCLEMEMRFQNKLPNDGKFLPKRLIFSQKILLLKFQHANRPVVTSTTNCVPEKTSIPSLEHRNFLPRARYTEPWADLEFGNGIPKDSDDFGNGIEKCLKLWNGNGVWNFDTIWNGNERNRRIHGAVLATIDCWR